MNAPVFFSQNQKTFSSPLSHPTWKPKKPLKWVGAAAYNQPTCGKAITSTAAKNTAHSHHERKMRHRQPATVIATIKLWTWTSGTRPAITPAPIIRLYWRGTVGLVRVLRGG